MGLSTKLSFYENTTSQIPVAETAGFKPFYSLVDECAANNPNSTSIKFNSACLSYQKLAESANRLARLLIGAGVKKGDVVAIALDRSPEMVISLLAVLKSGAAYLPLDPFYPRERIEFMLADSAASILLTSAKYQKYFYSGAEELLIDDAWPKLEQFDPADPGLTVTDSDLAYILYTSGSTGKPKGVMVSHCNLANLLLSIKKKPGIRADDRLLAVSTISFDIAGLELYLPLIAGAQIVLADAETARDGWLLLQLMRQEQITLMQATPYTWRMLIAAGWDERLPVRIITGGEQLPKDLAEKLLGRCDELWNQYGPTETTIYSTQKLIDSADDITIGKPVDQTQVYILDESLAVVPAGTSGEICIAGAGVANGYLNRPELTAERFINNPFSTGEAAKMYRTGDLGILMANGEVQCLGRLDQQVKIRGYRIEPGEIEYALLKIESIKAAAVIPWAEGPLGLQLIGYIVASKNNQLPEKLLLKQQLAASLPPFMIPDDFVFISSIPVTPNGKVDRHNLPRPLENGELPGQNFREPSTDAEKQLALIWEDVLGVKRIGLDDNFFSLGGHSLVAVQLMSRVKKITGRRLPISILLKYPTIAGLACHLNAEEATNGYESLVPIRPKGTKPPLYIIHGDGLNVLYFNDLAKKLDTDQPVYGLQARGFKGNEPLEVLEEIAATYVEEIVAQNPVGPYVLAGYSLGGYIAVEMRKQMTAMGKDVKLIIFDTDAEKSAYKGWLYLVPRKVKRRLGLATSQAKAFVADPINTFLSKKDAPSRSITKDDSKDFYREIKIIRDKLHSAVRNYSIEPFDDKVYLYKATICTHYVEDTEFLGWKKYAKKGVEICEVAGDHLSMLLHPNVDDFAVKLQNGINKLEVF